MTTNVKTLVTSTDESVDNSLNERNALKDTHRLSFSMEQRLDDASLITNRDIYFAMKKQAHTNREFIRYLHRNETSSLPERIALYDVSPFRSFFLCWEDEICNGVRRDIVLKSSRVVINEDRTGYVVGDIFVIADKKTTSHEHWMTLSDPEKYEEFFHQGVSSE